jgi:hypothetical protein
MTVLLFALASFTQWRHPSARRAEDEIKYRGCRTLFATERIDPKTIRLCPYRGTKDKDANREHDEQL